VGMSGKKEKTQEGVKNVRHTKNDLITLFNKCFNILRDNEHIVGEKALKTLSYLLYYKLIEGKIGTEINFEDYKHYQFENEEERVVLFDMLKMSNLVKKHNSDLMSLFEDVWERILSVHPITKLVFPNSMNMEIKSASTFRKLLNEVNEFNFSDIEEDILGEAYEEAIKLTMTSKILGQFFTPPIIKNLMIDMINPQV
jgi:type I restriction-modification system DNA methylase subunit